MEVARDKPLEHSEGGVSQGLSGRLEGSSQVDLSDGCSIRRRALENGMLEESIVKYLL